MESNEVVKESGSAMCGGGIVACHAMRKWNWQVVGPRSGDLKVVAAKTRRQLLTFTKNRNSL